MHAIPLAAASLMLAWVPPLDPTVFPSLDRPDNISAVVGSYEAPIARATPMSVRVEEPLVLTVRIKSRTPGPWSHPPKREVLRLFASKLHGDEFAKNFFIVDGDDRELPDDQSWEFDYLLYPKKLGVERIPPLELAYNQTVGKSDYKTVVSSAIPIGVKPRQGQTLTTPAVALGRMHPPAKGAWLLGAAAASPGVWWAAFALPPILCVAGVVMWRRLFPDAAARLRLRRSRALRMAHRRFARLGAHASAAALAEIFADYLRQRLDLTAREPTALEIAATLARAGLDAATVADGEQLWRDCDAARFGALPAPLACRPVADFLGTVDARLASGDTAKALVAVVICLLLLGAADSPTASDRLHEAEQRYAKGVELAQQPAASRPAFAEAAARYQQCVDGGHDHPQLLRNLGDAHLLADQLPQAIAAYRAALRRTPHDGVVWDHLLLAREQVPYPADNARHRPPGDRWPPLVPRLSPTQMLGAAAVALAVAWLLGAVWWLTRTRRLLAGAVVAFAAAIGLLGWRAYDAEKSAEANARPCVVVLFDNMPLQRGNGSLYPRHPAVPLLHRGMEAELLLARGEWVQIGLADGSSGWLPGAAVLQVDWK